MHGKWQRDRPATDRPRWPATSESGAIEGGESKSGRERASEVAAHVEKELNIASDAERGEEGKAVVAS